jgi:hypothetical protein
MKREQYQQLANNVADKYNIPRQLLSNLITHESGWNPNALSPAGAIGIAQFMPGTAKGMGVNPSDPISSIDGAGRLLSGHYNKYKSWPLALAAYNAGGGAVDKYKGIPPYKETQNYVRNIMAISGSGLESKKLNLDPLFIKPEESHPLNLKNYEIINSIINRENTVNQTQQPQGDPNMSTYVGPDTPSPNGGGNGFLEILKRLNPFGGKGTDPNVVAPTAEPVATGPGTSTNMRNNLMQSLLANNSEPAPVSDINMQLPSWDQSMMGEGVDLSAVLNMLSIKVV